MRVTEVIAGHTNTDFDAFAGMVAAARLYPRARICLTGALNENVRQFAGLYSDRFPIVDAGAVEHDAVERLVLIETSSANRLGELGPLLERRGIDVVVFDHHRPDDAGPRRADMDVVTTDDGAVTTLLLRILAERGIEITPLEATVFALGIHEDTGSLTFTTTTAADAEALAFCMQRGAAPALIERFLHHPLGAAQRDILARALRAAEPVAAAPGQVMIASLEVEDYVEEIAVIAHRFLDVTGVDAFFLVLGMEDRVFVVARSRLGALDVAAVVRAVGGGGHSAAASAVVRDRTTNDVATALANAVEAVAASGRRAADLVSGPAVVVGEAETIDHALVVCHREGVGGALVADGEDVVGSVSRADLHRAADHGLGHAPVKAVMSRDIPVVEGTEPAGRLPEAVAASPIGHVVVSGAPVTRGADRVARKALVGLVAGADALETSTGRHCAPPAATVDLAPRLAELGLDDLFEAVQAVATSFEGAYLVGGAVRDLLLHERTFDIDLAVEGDGIAFARQLAQRLGGHARAHPKFRTAVVVAGEEGGGEALRVDVATTRTEIYDGPGALPAVEPAPLQSDLARRDFTINAMAVSLRGDDYGALFDPFGGRDDLVARRVSVLHNLSFIEDPTRIFRALRYETRYGFRMEPRTLGLAATCADMGLVGDLSSARLRDELVLLLRERTVEHALRRLQELGLEGAVHPRVTTGPATRDLIRVTDTLWLRHGLAGEVPLWRLRLSLLVRDLEPVEIREWAERMRFRRTDAAVLARTFVVGARIRDRLQGPADEAEVFDLAEGEPLEAVLVAMALDRGGSAARRLSSYLERSRHVSLAIHGGDLRALGYPESPEIGRALRSVLKLRLSGVLNGGREEELDAVRQLLGDPETVERRRPRRSGGGARG